MYTDDILLRIKYLKNTFSGRNKIKKKMFASASASRNNSVTLQTQMWKVSAYLT